jgi:hypothetical protein
MRTDVKRREFWEWRDHTPARKVPMAKDKICVGIIGARLMLDSGVLHTLYRT